MRRECFRRVAAELSKRVDDGVMRFEVATEKLSVLIDTAGERKRLLPALEPYESFYAHFAEVWAWKDVPPVLPPRFHCDNDLFHNTAANYQLVLSVGMAQEVISKLQSMPYLCVVVRTTNDERYDPNGLGAVGISSPNCLEQFFAFPLSFPAAAEAIARCLGSKPVRCVNAHRAEYLMGKGYRFVEMASEPLVGRKRATDQTPLATALGRKFPNLDHCNNHFFNSFVHPYDISTEALRHAAVELFYLSRL